MTIFWWRCVRGTHPFPSRTRWLRPGRPMVLYWRRYGRVGGCQIYGGIAQLGEHLPCKQGVRSSNLLISISFKRKDYEVLCCGGIKFQYLLWNDCTLKTTHWQKLKYLVLKRREVNFTDKRESIFWKKFLFNENQEMNRYPAYANAGAKGQAKKSTGRMPWHWEPMKDVTSCDKLRLGANIHWPADFWMGKPGRKNSCHPCANP